MSKKPFLQDFNYLTRIFSLIVIIIISVFIFNLLGIAIAFPFLGNNILNILNEVKDIDKYINTYKYLQLINHLGMFLAPSVIYAFLVSRKTGAYLKINRMPHLFSLFSGILLIFVCLPFINWLMTINENMKLPSSMGEIEQWMRQSEENAAMLTEKFLQVTTPMGLLANIFIIALVPAVGEEFLFRGVLQKHFKRWTGNIHIAIIITSVLFSAMHLQFFGFLPRFILGIILGYLFYYSRNLWVSITAHFFNNAFATIIFYLNYNKIISTDLDKIGSEEKDYFVIFISFIFTIIIMFSIFKRERNKTFFKKSPKQISLED